MQYFPHKLTTYINKVSWNVFSELERKYCPLRYRSVEYTEVLVYVSHI